MTALLFIVTTYVLPGCAAAVVWHRLLGRRAGGRGLDTFVWIAASPFVVVAVYYLALALMPGRSTLAYRLGVSGFCVAAMLVQPRTAWATARAAAHSLRVLRRRHLRPASRTVMGLVGAAAVAVGVLNLLYASTALHLPYFDHDATLNATQGWEWREAQSLEYFRPTEPNARGFTIHYFHSPSFQLLNAWAANWMPERLDDWAMRSVSLGCHGAALLVLVVLTSAAGRWGPWWAVGLYASAYGVLHQVEIHGRDPYRVLGVLLCLAALQRGRRLPLALRGLAAGLGGAATLAGHTLGLLVLPMLAGAWGAAHAKSWRRWGATFAVAAPLAVGLGGRQYITNAMHHGDARGFSAQLATFRANPERWAQQQALRELPGRGTRDLGRKVAPLISPDSALAVPLGLAVVAVAAYVRRRRLPRLVGVVTVCLLIHVGLVVGLADVFVGRLSQSLAWNARYLLHMIALVAVALPFALAAAPRGRVRRGLQVGAIACVLVALGTSYQRAQGVPRYHRFPDFPPPLAEWPRDDPSVILRMAQHIGSAYTLEINVPELLYYTDVEGISFRDGRLTPVYLATTTAEQHRLLWDLGVRYIVAPDRMEAYLEAFGYSALFDTPEFCRFIERRQYIAGKQIMVFQLLPPAATPPARAGPA